MISTTNDKGLASPGADVATLLDEYVALCNRAIAENEHRFLFRQAKRLNRALWGETHFETLVYDRHPDDVVERASLHFDPDRRELSVRSAPDGDVAFTWKVPLSYLRDVARTRPDWYLEHPIMLDWNWWTDRLRDESRRMAGDRLAMGTFAAGVGVGAILGLTAIRAARA